MPVTRFETRNASTDRALAIEVLRQKVAETPMSPTHFKRFGVKNPHPDKYKLAWCDPEKLELRISRGAQVVSREDAKTLYRIPERELADGCAKRCKLILIRYPLIAWEAHRASVALESLALMSDPQANLAMGILQNGGDDRNVAMLDEDGRRMKTKGRGRNYNVGYYKRPESATLEDALAMQRERESRITGVLSSSEEERLSAADTARSQLSPEEEAELMKAVSNPIDENPAREAAINELDTFLAEPYTVPQALASLKERASDASAEGEASIQEGVATAIPKKVFSNKQAVVHQNTPGVPAKSKEEVEVIG